MNILDFKGFLINFVYSAYRNAEVSRIFPIFSSVFILVQFIDFNLASSCEYFHEVVRVFIYFIILQHICVNDV